jgi:multidrug efflux pump subunit AcrA (membrane-fusion protein)
VDDKDGQFVFVVKGGLLEKRKVKTGVMTENDVQIAQGLSAGDVVALSSAGQLKDGMKVKTGDER